MQFNSTYHVDLRQSVGYCCPPWPPDALVIFSRTEATLSVRLSVCWSVRPYVMLSLLGLLGASYAVYTALFNFHRTKISNSCAVHGFHEIDFNLLGNSWMMSKAEFAPNVTAPASLAKGRSSSIASVVILPLSCIKANACRNVPRPPMPTWKRLYICTRCVTAYGYS